MFTVVAEPRAAFRQAFGARLRADARLMSVITGVFGQLSEAARVDLPYLVFGPQRLDRSAGAMGLAGANVTLELDGWSAYKGPAQMEDILSRVSALMEREPLPIVGFEMVVGSLTCELSELYDEPDEDMPDGRLWRGHQRWMAEVHDAR